MGNVKSLLKLVLTGIFALSLVGSAYAAGDSDVEIKKEDKKTEAVKDAKPEDGKKEDAKAEGEEVKKEEGDAKEAKDAAEGAEKKECPEGTSFVEEAKSCVCEDKSKVYSEKAKQCVAKTAEILTDDDLYKNAVVLVRSKEYKVALDLLWRIKDQNQPRVLNYIGFTNRKLGKIDKGIGYYHKALALNANFHRARQYLGEGYLQKGDLKGAQEQLGELGKRCGKGCEYYQDLAQQIADFKARQA